MTDLAQDPEEYVTVGKFMEPIDAQMAKGLLESAGIECFLQGENANNLIAMAFRVRLQVHQKDEATAREMLGGEASLPDDDEVAG
jgi:Putative prokaryotic signal transducing protein